EDDVPLAIGPRIGRDRRLSSQRPGLRRSAVARRIALGQMQLLHTLAAEPVAVFPGSELVRVRVGRELLDRLRNETAAIGLRFAELEALTDLRHAELASV